MGARQSTNVYDGSFETLEAIDLICFIVATELSLGHKLIVLVERMGQTTLALYISSESSDDRMYDDEAFRRLLCWYASSGAPTCLAVFRDEKDPGWENEYLQN